MALPTYVAAGTVGFKAGAPVGEPEGLGMPAGVLADDILLLFVCQSFAMVVDTTLTDAQGFAAITGGGINSGNFGGVRNHQSVFWKRATGSDVVPTIAGDGHYNTGIIVAVRGCITTGEPIDVVSRTGDADGDNNILMAGETTTDTDRLVIGSLTAFHGGNVVSSVIDFNSDLTNSAVEVDADTAFPDTTHTHHFIWSGEKAVAGAYGDMTAVWDGGAPYHVSAGLTIALIPEPPAPVPPPAPTIASLGGIMTIALLGQNYAGRNQRLIYGPRFPALRRRR